MKTKFTYNYSYTELMNRLKDPVTFWLRGPQVFSNTI